MKGKLHQELGSFNFIEVEIEEDTEELFTEATMRLLGKLRLGYASIQENGIEGDIKPSEKQMVMLRRLIKERDKKTGDILRYLGGKRLTSLNNITKEEASEVTSMLMKKEEE